MAILKIREIQPNSQAANVGIRPGDDIVSFSGRPIETNEDFTMAVQQAQQEGKAVAPMVLDREGERLEVTVTPEQPIGVDCDELKNSHPSGSTAQHNGTGSSAALHQGRALTANKFGISRSVASVMAFMGLASAVLGGLLFLYLIFAAPGTDTQVHMAMAWSAYGIIIFLLARAFSVLVDMNMAMHQGIPEK